MWEPGIIHGNNQKNDARVLIIIMCERAAVPARVVRSLAFTYCVSGSRSKMITCNMYPSSRAGYAVSTYDMTCCNRQYLPGFVIFWCAQYSTIFRTYSATVKIEQYAGEQQGNPYLCFTTVLHFSVHTLNCKPSIRARNPVVTGGSR